MVKKIICMIIAMCLAFQICSCFGESETQQANPALYRVTDDAGHTLYLFGTIHVGKKDVSPLSDAVLQAYNASDALAVEIDLKAFMEDAQAMLAMSQGMMLSGEKTSDLLGAELVERAAQKIGYPVAVVDVFKPYALLSLLQEGTNTELELDSNYGADLALLQLAHTDGKTIYEQETIEEQLSLEQGMSNEYAAWQIGMYLDESDLMSQEMWKLYDVWCKGDVDGIRSLLKAEQDEIPEELAAEDEAFYTAMFTERDAAFVEDAKQYLAGGETVFFAVGAAHILGENGVVEQLSAMGYKVEDIR